MAAYCNPATPPSVCPASAVAAVSVHLPLRKMATAEGSGGERRGGARRMKEGGAAADRLLVPGLTNFVSLPPPSLAALAPLACAPGQRTDSAPAIVRAQKLYSPPTSTPRSGRRGALRFQQLQYSTSTTARPGPKTPLHHLSPVGCSGSPTVVCCRRSDSRYMRNSPVRPSPLFLFLAVQILVCAYPRPPGPTPSS